jgi:hypothetical protein
MASVASAIAGSAVRHQHTGSSTLRRATRRTAMLPASSRRGAGLKCDAKLGIVGGSNLNDSTLFNSLEKKLVSTEYGDVVIYCSKPGAERDICFVKRHYCGPDEG